MSRQNPQFHVRLPADLLARIKEDAAKNRRSITAEIIYKLEQALKKPYVHIKN